MSLICCSRGLCIALSSNSAQHVKLFRKRYILQINLSTSPIKSKQSSLLSFTLAGLGAGALIGGGYSLFNSFNVKPPVINTHLTRPPIKDFPAVQVSRRVISETDTSGLQLTLFQYPTCPFCCKVRAFLNYHGISYDVVEVNPVLRQQIKWTDYKKVPILLAKIGDSYEQLNDSSMIVSALSSYLQDSQQTLSDLVKFYPIIAYRDDDGSEKSEIMNRYFLMLKEDLKGRTKEDLLEERKWRMWADNVLVHTLSPNVYRNREESLQAFLWFSEVGEWDRLFSSWERNLIVYVGAYAMLMVGKRLKKRHNLKEDVRQSLYDECNYWMKALKTKKSLFMGGNQPNLADLAVYGVLSSIEGCTAFQDLLKNTQIGKWYWPMKELIEAKSGVVKV